MPDPFEYLKSVLAAMTASAAMLLLFHAFFSRRGKGMFETADVVSSTCGIFAGYLTLNYSWPWPPANALDRFLTIVLPAVFIIELVAAIQSDYAATIASTRVANGCGVMSRGVMSRTFHVCIWIARCLLCCGIGRILMHGSIYLDDLNSSSSSNREAWLIQNMSGILAAGSTLLMAMWFALVRLATRTASNGLVLSLSLCFVSVGCTTMMAGYIKGGSAALPFATVLMVSALALQLWSSKRRAFNEHGNGEVTGTAMIGIGLVSLLGLVWIGRFFGQLTSIDAMVMFLTPSLCWITELPPLRNRSRTMKFIIRMIAVIAPLAILLADAKREFDEKMAPLL